MKNKSAYLPPRLGTVKHDISGTPSNLHIKKKVDGGCIVAKLNGLEELLLLR